MNPCAVPTEKIPRKIPQTNPTPPDESDTTGQVFLQIRMIPTPPDHSDRLQPPHNPSVVGSIPTGPTKFYQVKQESRRFRLRILCYSKGVAMRPPFMSYLDEVDLPSNGLSLHRAVVRLAGAKGQAGIRYREG